MHQCRSPKVRKILEYEGRAAKLLGARYEGRMAEISPAKHRADQLLHRAKALKVTLTPSELSELRRVRSGV